MLIVVLPLLFSVVPETIQILLSVGTIHKRVMSATYFMGLFIWLFCLTCVELQDNYQVLTFKPDFSLLSKDQPNQF